jgi:hypothetical protein
MNNPKIDALDNARSGGNSHERRNGTMTHIGYFEWLNFLRSPLYQAYTMGCTAWGTGGFFGVDASLAR